MLNNLSQPHEYPGKLFVVEGIDGSGKTTQLALLAKWLSAAGLRVFVTEWNSSALVKAATKAGKKKNALTPTTFSLLHATDFADRQLYNIIPPLKAGMIVLADRYAYTAFARDATRGVDRRWVRELYSFAVKPDLAVYFRVPIEVATDRLLARRVRLKLSTHRWPTSSAFACWTRGARSTSSRTSCAGRSAPSWRRTTAALAPLRNNRLLH